MKALYKYKEILFSFFALISTQIMVPIKILGSVKYLYLFDFLMLFVCFYLFFKIIIKKQKFKIDIVKIIILSLFFLWFIIASIYKIKIFGDLNGNFIILRVVFWPLILYFLYKTCNMQKKNLSLGIVLFLLVINIMQIINIIFITNTFRGATILHNINIYIVVCTACLPLLMKMLSNVDDKKENKWKKLLKSLILIIIFVSHLIISLSGTRIGFFIYPFVLLISYLNNFGFKITLKRIIGVFTYIISLIIVIMALCSFNVYDSKDNVYRAISPIVELFINNSKNSNNKEDNNDKVSINNEEYDEETLPSEITKLTYDSDNMRTKLWKKSIEYIKENPILGKNNVDIKISVNLLELKEPVEIIQAPHNFILELWLAFGLPGMLLFLIFMGYSYIKIIIKNKLNANINLIIMLFAIFGCSFFQPLVTCYFVVSILLWMNIFVFE